jgi:hypothetical protein
MTKAAEAVQQVEASATPIEKELTFVLKLNQANIILSALDEIPHKLSRPIIDELQKQAFPQMQETEDSE